MGKAKKKYFFIWRGFPNACLEAFLEDILIEFPEAFFGAILKVFLKRFLEGIPH